MPGRFATGLAGLFDLVARLRGPQGCPWDQSQSAASMVGHFLEEAYELVEAVAAEDVPNVQEELGDVLFLLVFVASFYIDQGQFNFDQVIDLVQQKMVRRHPHVFGAHSLDTPEQVSRQWQTIKVLEKEAASSPPARSPGVAPEAASEDLPALPTLRRAMHVKGDEGLSALLLQTQAHLARLQDSDPADITGNAHETVGRALLNLARIAKKMHVCPETALRGRINNNKD